MSKHPPLSFGKFSRPITRKPCDRGRKDSRIRKVIDFCKKDWTLSEKNTAAKAVRNLKGEKEVDLIGRLPPTREKNAKTATDNGIAMTDVLATWLKKGFVAGPFDSPPCEDFRPNPLMAAIQRFKVRPILNLSSPKGGSFNDAVNDHEVDLLTMSSQRLFGDALRKAGKGASFSQN
jgi:hypothetical protein